MLAVKSSLSVPMVNGPKSPAKLFLAVSSTWFWLVTLASWGMVMLSKSTDKLVEPRSTLLSTRLSMPAAPRIPKMLVGLAKTRS